MINDKISKVLHFQGATDDETRNNLLQQFSDNKTILELYFKLKSAAIAEYPQYFSQKIGNVNDKTGMFN